MTRIPCNDIPGPNGSDMLRGIGLMRRNPPLFLEKCKQRYGDVVSFPIPRNCVLFVSDPPDVRRVLQQNHVAYQKRTLQYRALATVTGDGLLVSDGDIWRRMRRLEQPGFRGDVIDAMVPAVLAQTDRLLERWRRLSPSTVIDLEREMSDLAMDVVGVTLCGINLGSSARTMVSNVATALDVAIGRSQRPAIFTDRIPSRADQRLRRSLSVIDRCVDRIIVERRKQAPGSDVLWLLLAALDDGLTTPAQVRNELVTLIVAGHETVATALTWTWLLLAGSPTAARRLTTEVGQTSAGWDSDTLEGMPYTRAVINESLRLFPPAWVISRRSVQPDVVGGYEIPAGTTVIVSPYVVHRDARFWSRPEQFEPQRFLDGPAATGASPAYLPFGAGPRLCIGRDLALMEACLVLARISSQVSIAPTSTTMPRIHYGATMRPQGGLPVTVSAR
jgi:cytochrome P450